MVRDGAAKQVPFYLPGTMLGKAAEVLALCVLEYDSWEGPDGKRAKVGLKVLRVEVFDEAVMLVTDGGGSVWMQGGKADALLVGHVSRDSEVRYAPNGDAVITLPLGVNEVYKDRSGVEQTRVHWVDATAWRELAEASSEVKRGTAVLADSSDDRSGATVECIRGVRRHQKHRGQVPHRHSGDSESQLFMVT